MANTLTTWIFVILLGLSADGARKVPYSITGHDGTSLSSLVGDDGICKAMVETQGYVCEEHTVTTKDGYMLSMQRMPMGRSGKKSDKPPVLLQHGILTDASSWLLDSPDESLAFILADNGYDVWLVSTRGTKYSSGHTSLSPSDPAYWNWSWDELAAYDLPASFEYVHDETGQKLHYVGHSLGTLMALAAFSQDNLLNMLRSAALFCPIAYLNQIPTLLAKVAADSFIAEDLYWLGLYEFVPGGEAAAKLVEDICQKTHSNCSNLMPAFTGKNCCVNSSKINILLDHEPQPTATKNMIHLSQMIRKGTIAMYDYGSEAANNKQYGQPIPPVYNMTSIPNDVPLFLGYGGQDMISDVKDVHTLLDSLKDHDADKLVLLYREEYAHVDFVFGINANQVVYDPLMSFFKLN
ncbi:triacylglycerol lipase 2-like [Actinidia eriantha]|uniref:triacylglycerol lipase 2-like n=1 Tax=Actinidia eriantha TaxID=165200 RepID=UPI002586851D|nr:triacylglycerol lipase 2-like [Actinidia eriantha]